MSAPHDKIIIRDMIVMMSVGIHAFEKENLQRVIINADISVPFNKDWNKDDIGGVLSYADIVEQIETIAKSEHINLVEVFAERIASVILAHDKAMDVRVRVEKPDIFDNIAGIGVEIFRAK